MLIDEMRLKAEANDSNEAEDINSAQKEKASKKKDFYEFNSDEVLESTSCDPVEMEAARYFSNAKHLVVFISILQSRNCF